VYCCDCKFSSLSDETRVKDGRVLACSCEKFKLTYSSEKIEDDEVQVEIDEGWGFTVGPKFGCIHFQSK